MSARIILDAMGSDTHPAPEVEAAIQSARMFGDEIILVGNQSQLTPLVNGAPGVRIVHAPDVFEMTDKISPGALRKVQSSMGIAADLLKAGEADAFVTAGNTGGAMAISLARLGRIRGVKRPALCALFPVKGGHCVVADVGANTECRPEYLVQFAQMGAVYARLVLGKANPRIGLLANGEEEMKGNDLVKETHPLLKAGGLNFIGNVEGKELFGGHADVVVTDGFTGNILLKSSEAVAKLLIDTLRAELMGGLRTKIGALLAKPAFNALRKLLDPAEIGAVPLLGLDGLVFVGHGRSDARALVSAIRSARAAVEANLMQQLRTEMGSAGASDSED